MRLQALKNSLYGVLCIVACAGAVLTSGGVQAEDAAIPLGPIELQNQHPLQTLHYTFSPESARLLPSEETFIRFSSALSSTLNRQDREFLIDAETAAHQLQVRRRLDEDIELGIGLGVTTRGSGFMDHGIREFHEVFGFPNGERDFVRDNDYAISGTNNADGSIGEFRSGTSIADTDLRAKFAISKTDDSAVSAVVGLRLPTAKWLGPDTPFGQGAVDTSIGLLGQQSFGDFTLHGGLSYAYFGDERIAGVEFTPHNASAFSTIEYIWSENNSLQASLTGRYGGVDNLQNFARYDSYFDVGYARRITKGSKLEFLLRENPQSRSTVDVTFALGVAFLW